MTLKRITNTSFGAKSKVSVQSPLHPRFSNKPLAIQLGASERNFSDNFMKENDLFCGSRSVEMATSLESFTKSYLPSTTN